MDRRPELPATDPDRPIKGDSDILSHVNAVFKRHRSLGALQNFPRASRVLVPQEEPLMSTGSIASVAGRKLPKTVANRGADRSLAVGSDQKKDSVVEIRTTPVENSSLNPPSVTGTVTHDWNNNLDCFGMEKGDAELLLDQKKASLACSSSSDNFKKDQFSSAENSGVTFHSVDARMTIDTRMDDITSYLRSLALTEGEDQFANQVPLNYQDLNQHGLPSMEISNATGAHIMEKIDDLRRSQQTVDSMTRSTIVGSSCVTTMSVHSGPIYQCTHAPLAAHTGVSTQMSSVVEKSFSVSTHHLPEGQEVMAKESVGSQHRQPSLHMGEGIRENILCSNASHLQSQATSSNILTSNMEPSKSSKVEKAPRKKKYDPDVFFKVNGKLYQKLGKIGSGGSSEVHKVITSDCIIHALKKIKLKGRDFPTAYGFCQEIEYLNKLKEKTNIIQLIDYEVTDKTLLQEGMNSSMAVKDGRIKDDQYIYMVLEYGEIDLAHMLSQKWREVERTSSKIDENWLRFYWQQMLEAVNTIHEERIVHSDLKPANFLLVKGSLKLIDFGIAKAILSDTTNIERDAQVGTLNYMSPEAFMWNEHDSSGNTIKLGRPSDIWSLGCILYQMVYGKTPFAKYQTFWSKFKVITDKNHEINYEATTNPLLVDLMRRCLAWERNERWRIPQLLQHPFLAPAAIPRAMPLPLEVNLLLEKIGLYWNDNEVSRLCKELHRVVDNLERANKE